MIDELIEQLHTQDPSGKRNALEALYDYSEDDRVIEAAAYLLTDPDRGVREAASHVLVLCLNEKAASLTATHIQSMNIAVRNLAGDALVRMQSVAVNALLPYVESPDKDVRKFAIDILAQLPATTESVEKIATHLRDTDQNVVCASVDALGALHANQHVGELLELYDEAGYARPNVVNAAAKIQGNADLQFFVKALSDQDPIVQLAAADALSTRKDRETMDILLEKLNQVSGLAKPVILHSLVVLLESADRKEAMPEALKPDLLEMLDDPDPTYVRTAVRGLAHLVDDEVLHSLINHIGKADSIDAAILAVLTGHAKKSIPIALARAQAIDNPVSTIKMIVLLIQNLSDTSFRFSEGEETRAMAEFIGKHLSSLDVETRIIALSKCISLGNVWAQQLVRASLNDPETAVKILALDLAAKLGPRLFEKELDTLTSDDDVEIRSTAIILVTQSTSNRRN